MHGPQQTEFIGAAAAGCQRRRRIGAQHPGLGHAIDQRVEPPVLLDCAALHQQQRRDLHASEPRSEPRRQRRDLGCVHCPASIFYRMPAIACR